MYEFFLALLVLNIGLSAYLTARRRGNWSWGMFGKVMLLLGAALVIVIPATLYLGRVLGPEHAGLAALLTVIMCVAMVAGIVILLLPKKTG